MPSSVKKQMDSGMLSPNLAGALTGHSGNTIRKFMLPSSQHGGIYLTPIHLPGTREVRVSAVDLLRLCLRHRHPFQRGLIEASLNYAHLFETSTVPHIKKVLHLFDTNAGRDQMAAVCLIPVTPPEQRVGLPTPQESDPPQFDEAGNVLLDSPPGTTEGKIPQ